MHRALQVIEIILAILEPLPMEDVVGCSTVCQTWFFPSIKIIWNSVEITTVLRQLFQETKTSQEDGVVKWVTRRTPSHEDWQRLRLYTSQVRHLMIMSTYQCWDWTLEASRMWLASTERAKGILFPRVTSCFFSPGNDEHAKFGAEILSQLPRLEGLVLDESIFPGGYFGYPSLALQSVFPTIKYVTIKMMDMDREAHKRYWDDLCSILPQCVGLQRFASIDSNEIPCEGLAILSSMPNITRLEINLTKISESNTSALFKPGNACIFPKLETLRLRGMPNVDLSQDAWFPPKSLRVCEVQGIKAHALQSVIDKLATNNPSMHSLDFQDVGRFSSSDFCALSAFRGLRNLQLNFGILSVSDIELEKLAKALPELETFLCRGCGADYTLTLLSIYHLTRFCLRLSSVTMDFDATLIPSLDPSLPFPPKPSSITSSRSSARLYLDPCYSPLIDPVVAVEWLIQYCCNGVNIRIDQDEERYSEYYEQWQEVAGLLYAALYYDELGEGHTY